MDRYKTGCLLGQQEQRDRGSRDLSNSNVATGTFSLHSVHLKPAFVDSLDLPFRCNRGMHRLKLYSILLTAE